MLLNMPHVMPSFNIDQPANLFFFWNNPVCILDGWAVDSCRVTQLLKAIGKMVPLRGHYQHFSISLPIDNW